MAESLCALLSLHCGAPVEDSATVHARRKRMCDALDFVRLTVNPEQPSIFVRLNVIETGQHVLGFSYSIPPPRVAKRSSQDMQHR